MSEAFIPPAPATPEPEITLEYQLAHLTGELEIARRTIAGYRERELEREPLVEAIQHIVDQRLDQWVRSEGPLEVLGALIESSVEDQLSSSIDSHIEAALENASIEVEAYIRP